MPPSIASRFVRLAGSAELERAEERGGEDQEEQRHRHHDPAVLQHRPEHGAGETSDDTEGHEHRDDAEHERRGERGALPAALGLARTEDAHRDGDHRVNARREAHDEASGERCERRVHGAPG
jgi:hypothetical protein